MECVFKRFVRANGIVFLVAFISLMVFAFLLSCSSGQHISSSQVVISDLDKTNNDSNSQLRKTEPSRTVSLEQVITEINAYELPVGDDAQGRQIDPVIIDKLKAELARQLTERTMCIKRLVSAAPLGDAGRVTDLTYNAGTGRLIWSYINVGDYDSSGEVGIPDITPIAQNYLAKTNDGIGDDALESWIDGDESLEVGISDITPIAQGYMNDVTGYRIVTSSDENGNYYQIGTFIPINSFGEFPIRFNAALPAGALEFVAVEPIDSAGNAGERSVPVQIANDPPLITSVNPLSGVTGTQIQFEVTATGSTPFSYSWSFGGGAVPNTSLSVSPTVTLTLEGTYDAHVTLTNAWGSDTFDFTLTVTGSGITPAITDVLPLEGVTGTDIQFNATVDGTAPLSYDWNFGGGATPDSSSDTAPTVTLGSVGSYDASLVVTNAAGSDTFNFTLTITDTAIPPTITDVTPHKGSTDTNVLFSATVTGSPPLTYAWSFGGGATPNDSSETSPTVMLGAEGTYNASLTVTNLAGDDTFDFELEVSAAGTLEILGVEPTTAVPGSEVQFYAYTSSTDTLSYEWNFGSGCSPSVSYEENPLVSIVSTGFSGISVCSLTASGTEGTDTEQFVILIDDLPEEPVLTGFRAYPMAGQVPLAVTFNLTGCAPTPDNYEIDFDGDGTFDFQSTDQNIVQHRYESSGDFIAVARINGSSTETVPVIVFDEDPLAGSVGDSLFVTSSKNNFSVGDKLYLCYFINQNANQLANINTIRIDVPMSMAEGTHMWNGDYYRDYEGICLSGELQQPTFVDIGINWAHGTVQPINRVGLASVVEFDLLSPGTVNFEIIAEDDKGYRTYYSDLTGTRFYWSVLGKDYGSGSTPIFTINVT